jgi:hypothetical protein
MKESAKEIMGGLENKVINKIKKAKEKNSGLCSVYLLSFTNRILSELMRRKD